MSEQRVGEYAVLPDKHGDYESTAPIIDYYAKLGCMIIFAGDAVDRGPDSAKMLGYIRSLDDRAQTIVGNHEWILRNALAEDHIPNVDTWREQMWPEYENRLLKSYGLKRTSNWMQNAGNLREVMLDNGDLDWLNSLPPFFATDQFIVVHGGPLHNVPWTAQAAELTYQARPGMRMVHAPTQILDPDHKLATVRDIPNGIDDRIFVTGHSHLHGMSAQERVGQNHVRLASGPKDPTFVWESWPAPEGQIRVFDL